jgi:hypothetical protein
MDLEGVLLYSQEPAAGFYPEPDESSPHPSEPKSPYLLLSGFSTAIFVHFSALPCMTVLNDRIK